MQLPYLLTVLDVLSLSVKIWPSEKVLTLGSVRH
jgi:hypothetical protein